MTSRLRSRSTAPLSLGSAAAVSVGVAGNDGLALTLRTIPSVLLIVIGLACLANAIAARPVRQLRRSTRRWWLLTVAAFLPYAVATAPSSPNATAAADALHATGVVPVLEALAGGLALCAITASVVSGFAVYGVHPGAPSPEERVLEEQRGD